MKHAVYLRSDDSNLLQYWQNALADVAVCQILSEQWPCPSGSLVVLDTRHYTQQDWQGAQILQYMQNFKVIVASTEPSDPEGYVVLHSGACGYCHAMANAEVLQQVISVVAAGEIWAGRTLVQRMIQSFHSLPRQEVALTMLSDREQAVAQLVSKGLSNKEIARDLNITERTVKAHLTSIFEKLHVEDRLQLVLHIFGIR